MKKKVLQSKDAEKVLVVKRADLFAGGIWQGINTRNLQKYIKIISSKREFLPRGEVETDANWQQIIPYLIVQKDGSVFLMRRKATHTDTRLANMYSIGVGGHINKKDVGTNKVMDWAKREFAEEIEYKGKYKAEIVGILNDDSNDVGLVHSGLIIKVTADSDEIKVRDEHKSGEFIRLDQVGKHYRQMETWSQIVYDFLMAKSNDSSSPSIPQGKLRREDKRKFSARSNNISGVLPDWLIEKYIKEGHIQISPLEKNWKDQIDQVSIDFHLGTDIKLFRGGAYRFIDTRRGLPSDAMEEVNLKEGDPFILEPGAFAITSTQEVLKLPRDILGRLEGKSSLARLGILVHSTAARFDPGWNGAPVLELGNLGPKPAILYAGMPICAFTFEKLAAPVKMGYEGSRSDRYSGSKVAIASRIERHGKR